MVTFRKALPLLVVLALFTGLVRSTNAEQYKFAITPSDRHVSAKSEGEMTVIYHGKKTKIRWIKMEDLDREWAKVLYIFYKPRTNEEWFQHRIYQQYERDENGKMVRTRHRAWLFQTKKRESLSASDVVVLEKYDGLSPEDSSVKFCEFLEKKFDLSFEQFWF